MSLMSNAPKIQVVYMRVFGRTSHCYLPSSNEEWTIHLTEVAWHKEEVLCLIDCDQTDPGSSSASAVAQHKLWDGVKDGTRYPDSVSICRSCE